MRTVDNVVPIRPGIVVDKPRPKKRPTVTLGGEAPAVAESARFAFCPHCHTATPMIQPVRRLSNGIAITSGKCACGRETFRVGSVGSEAGDLS